jgi:hypothetical protein
MLVLLTGIIIVGMIVIFIGAPIISICLRRMNYDQLI